MSRSCRADERIAAKLDSWNGEEVKRTRPSPAIRSLTLSPSPLVHSSYDHRKKVSVQN